MKWLDRLKSGLNKTSTNLVQGLVKSFTHKKLDSAALEEIEEVLLTADLGVNVSAKIIADLVKDKFDKEISVEDLRKFIAEKLQIILEPVVKEIKLSAKPHVIMFCGVNGNGKTTTVGKLACQYKSQGKKVMMAACDTFRAAAVEQLEVWSGRVGCPIISGDIGADPASVAYKAMEAAYCENVDILLIDTAGRLHNKTNLMDELNKIVRVINKFDNNAPHDTIIVIDATTGQNAITQVEVFSTVINPTGLIITKLDGTAKGGIVISIAHKFAIPLVSLGVGEGINDLIPFNAAEYANNLMGINQRKDI